MGEQHRCRQDWAKAFLHKLQDVVCGKWYAAHGKKSFNQRLIERGYKETKSGGARFYVGLKWIYEAYLSQVEGSIGTFLGDSDNSPF